MVVTLPSLWLLPPLLLLVVVVVEAPPAAGPAVVVLLLLPAWPLLPLVERPRDEEEVRLRGSESERVSCEGREEEREPGQR